MDQTRDLSGQQLYKFAQLYDAPEFVKKAGVAELCGDETLPVDCYADPVHRRFPCHTQAATWTSTAFFLDKKASMRRDDVEFIGGRLAHFARYHRIDRSIKALLQKAAEHKTAPAEFIPDEDYGLIYQRGEETVRRYPLRNVAEVKSAAAYLQKNRDHFPYKLRRDFADKILQKAAAHAVKLDLEQEAYLERQAGYGHCTAKTAAEFIVDRVRASRQGPGPLNEAQTEMLKLAEVFEKEPSKLHAPGMLVKLAETLDIFDRGMGLHHDYNENFPRIEEVLFDLTQKKMAAAVKDHCSTITGNIYQLTDLEKVALEDIRNYLGDDIAEALRRGNSIDSEKAAEVIPTLDRSAATLFDELMSRVGLAPVAKEASAHVGLTRNYLLEMAHNYRQNAGKF